MAPLGAAGWFTQPVSVKPESRPKRDSQRSAPQRAPEGSNRPQAQPQAQNEGRLQALPGGWTDGKELARIPRKANSLLKLLYEGLANVQREKEGGGRRGKNRNIRGGRKEMDGVPSTKASVMALLCPFQPLAFMWSQTSSKLTNTSANPAMTLLHYAT